MQGLKWAGLRLAFVAGGLLVALLAIAFELLLALLQRAITSPGIRSESKIRVRNLATDRVPPGLGPAL